MLYKLKDKTFFFLGHTIDNNNGGGFKSHEPKSLELSVRATTELKKVQTQ